MSRRTSWKTILLCGGAILFGIVLGQLIGPLAGGLWNAGRQPAAAQAAESVPTAVEMAASADPTYICTPSYIGAFANRVHVLCTVAAPGGIYYFAAPTSNSKNAARVLSIMLTAKSLGKNLQIIMTQPAMGQPIVVGSLIAGRSMQSK